MPLAVPSLHYITEVSVWPVETCFKNILVVTGGSNTILNRERRPNNFLLNQIIDKSSHLKIDTLATQILCTNLHDSHLLSFFSGILRWALLK